MDAWQPRLDVHVGYCPVPVGSNQVLLQFSLLGKNDDTPPCAPFNIHCSSPPHANEHCVRPIAAWPVYGADVVDLVVWRGVGWSLDRVFIGATTGRVAPRHTRRS